MQIVQFGGTRFCNTIPCSGNVTPQTFCSTIPCTDNVAILSDCVRVGAYMLAYQAVECEDSIIQGDIVAPVGLSPTEWQQDAWQWDCVLILYLHRKSSTSVTANRTALLQSHGESLALERHCLRQRQTKTSWDNYWEVSNLNNPMLKRLDVATY